jgi:hypothetical protein
MMMMVVVVVVVHSYGDPEPPGYFANHVWPRYVDLQLLLHAELATNPAAGRMSRLTVGADLDNDVATTAIITIIGRFNQCKLES